MRSWRHNNVISIKVAYKFVVFRCICQIWLTSTFPFCLIFKDHPTKKKKKVVLWSTLSVSLSDVDVLTILNVMGPNMLGSIIFICVRAVLTRLVSKFSCSSYSSFVGHISPLLVGSLRFSFSLFVDTCNIIYPYLLVENTTYLLLTVSLYFF